MNTLKEKLVELLVFYFNVLGSPRFWQLVVAAVFFYLKSTGKVSAEVADGIMLILFGSVAIRTIDKLNE